MPTCSVEEALEDIKEGKMVILCDDEDPESKGDLVVAAEKITPDAINFMAKYGRGIICLSLCEEKLRQLELPLMVNHGGSPFATAFAVSIDARGRGVTTGISAADRATTILTAIADDARPEDLTKPGHIFPLQSRQGGVLKRTGVAEGSVDLARLAGLRPAGVICGIMNDDGTMARMSDLEDFSAKHNLKIITVVSIINYRIQKEPLVRRVATSTLPTYYGDDFTFIVYESEIDASHHLALIKGAWGSDEPVLVRVHSECLPGDTLGAKSCQCGDKLRASMKMIQKEGRGAIVYMRREEQGKNLSSQCRTLLSPEEGCGSSPEDRVQGLRGQLRDYGVGAQILRDLGVRRLCVITNKPLQKIVGLQGYGLTIEEQVPFEVLGLPRE